MAHDPKAVGSAARQSSPIALVLAGAILVLTTACGSPIAGAPASPGMSPPVGTADPAADPLASGELAVDPCLYVAATESQLEVMRSVELRLPNRDELDIELGSLQAAVDELTTADFGTLTPQVEEPLTDLGYRLIELELAVEDFRTNPRLRPAAAHVEEDAQSFADALAGLALLARC